MPAIPPRGDAVALTRTLVAIDSRNPSLVSDGPGESACAPFDSAHSSAKAVNPERKSI